MNESVGRHDGGPPEPISSQVFSVPIEKLVDADPLRLAGVDLEHARLLAQVSETLPPILVNEATMRVIDGMHRLRAAQLNGESMMEVRFHRGSEADAFRTAVRANVTHGLPLTHADRRLAVHRIVRAEPHLSNRAVAGIAGLAPATVAAIRADIENGQGLSTRVGRDGRIRPLSTAEGRRIASEIIARRPQASLRDVAREAGISVGTARDVRSRVLAGRDPVPPSQVARPPGRSRGASTPVDMPVEVTDAETDALLAGLRRDPSLRYSETGRLFLQFLGNRIVKPLQLKEATRELPPHCAIVVARLARQCAQSWMGVAESLDAMGSRADHS